MRLSLRRFRGAPFASAVTWLVGLCAVAGATGCSGGSDAGGAPAAGGTGNAGNTGGSTSGGGSGSGGATGNGPPCIPNPIEGAAFLGDSYVTGAWSPDLRPALAALYSPAGWYPLYAAAGSSMATGGLPDRVFIPIQFDQAIAEHPNLVFTIMDGGGNDILLCDTVRYPSCDTLCAQAGSSTLAMCVDIVNQALVASRALMDKAANAGVRDVVYFFYPHIPMKNGGYAEILDYSEPLARAACDEAATVTQGKLTCHFVSLVQPFIDAGGDLNPANFVSDGIHPSEIGQGIIASEIWKVMQRECLGQSSGCCTP